MVTKYFWSPWNEGMSYGFGRPLSSQVLS
jgi:hypothetical protein